MAEWQNGYAADCKSVDLGSTPGSASTIGCFDVSIKQITKPLIAYMSSSDARVVKLVDTRDLKSLVRKDVPVQVRPRAPFAFCYIWLNLTISYYSTT